MPQAVACFEKAIALDPHYAEAMAWLSDSYRLMGVFGVAPFAEVMPKAKRIAERALAMDPGLAEAWATLASVEEQYERNFARGDSLYERALTVDPRHSRARSQRALYGYARGACSSEVALAEMRRAVQDDPLNAWVGAMNSFVLGFAGQHQESIAEAERSMSLDPDSFLAHWNLMCGHAWAGEYDHAIGLAPTLMSVSGRHQWALGLLAWTYGKAGRKDATRAVYDELEARSRHEFISPFWLATAAGAAGVSDQSIHWVERAVVERDPLVIWGRVVLFWDAVRAHPRFEDVMRDVWG